MQSIDLESLSGIKEMIALLENKDWLEELEIAKNGTSLMLRKNGFVSSKNGKEVVKNTEPKNTKEDDVLQVKSEGIGVGFFTLALVDKHGNIIKAKKDQEPPLESRRLKEDDEFNKDDILGCIASLKTIETIKAPFDGVILKIDVLGENGENKDLEELTVEHGEVLFTIRKK